MRQYMHQHPFDAPALPKRSSSAGHCSAVSGRIVRSVIPLRLRGQWAIALILWEAMARRPLSGGRAEGADRVDRPGEQSERAEPARYVRCERRQDRSIPADARDARRQ